MNQGREPTTNAGLIRPPRQARTKAQWARILDEGVAILEEEGYDGFTIAALCERAEVQPPAIYARVDTKEDLFLAVYEHAVERMTESEAVFDDAELWESLEAPARIDRAVTELVRLFVDHARFLRAVVLVSANHPEILRRGEENQRLLEGRFIAAIALDGTGGAERQRFCFRLVFSALSMWTAYPGLGPSADPGDATAELRDLIRGHLLGPGGSRS